MTLNRRLLAFLLPVLSVTVTFAVSCGSDDAEPAAGSSTPTASSTQDPNGASASAGPASTPEASLDLGAADSLLSVTLSAEGDILQGISALAVGDFNGDSVDDLLIGAPFADRSGPGGEDAGEAYVIFGSPGLEGALDLAVESPDLLIRGAIGGDTLGFEVAAGDLNGDGIDDVIIGAPASWTLERIRTDLGEAYVIFGRPDLGGVIDTLQAEQDFTLIPAEGFARLGSSFAIADLNGDGIDDLAAGAPFGGREPGTPPGGPRTTVGEVYIVFGAQDLSGQRTVARKEQDVLLSGARKLDGFGESLAAADVDGDGRIDLIVGSSGFEAPGRDQDSGAVFVFHGSSQWPDRLVTDDAGLTVLGTGLQQGLGEAVRAADLDADDMAEVIAAARGADGPGGRTRAGRVYVVAGADRTGEVDGSESRGVIHGPDIGSGLPLSLLVADVDGDGVLDITASAVLTSSSASGVVGVVYVVMNGAEVDTKDLSTDLSGTLLIEAANENDGTGTGLAVGDLNGDGTPELVVSVVGNQTVGEQASRPVIHALNLK